LVHGGLSVYGISTLRPIILCNDKLATTRKDRLDSHTTVQMRARYLGGATRKNVRKLGEKKHRVLKKNQGYEVI
jgi:hypothetical protein